jgi:pteridine reductase
MKLSGTAALVTGGARRVGRAIVIELARAGCDVAIHCRRSRADAGELAAMVAEMGGRAAIVEGDLCQPASWPRVIEQTVGALGGLDILVNNASMFLPGQLDMDKADSVEGFDSGLWESMLRVNVVAPAALCHHAREHLAARSRGRVVNLCDIAGDRPWPSALAYCASKAALAALTKGLARAMAPAVRVNGVAPGIAVFPDEYSTKLRESLTSQVPLGRAGTPEEVARLVRFLVESGDYITGQIVPIDGGRSIA